ncbi:MAG: TlpA family protein disulfide reductase [Deinococcus sp.]|nr:TlpA family protein disulfide reductase [Deinococcus sp.]
MQWQTWRKVLLPLVIVVPLVLVLAFGFRRDPREIPSPLVGKPAFPLVLTLYDGGTISLDELGGKVVVVNFWASWCYPACWNEAPVLQEGWETYQDRGVVFLGVDIQDTEQAARQFIERFQLTFPNGPDTPGGENAINYGVYGVPETFFIDREGRIAYKHVGEITRDLLQAKIEELL